jgi:hypothetical protein
MNSRTDSMAYASTLDQSNRRAAYRVVTDAENPLDIAILHAHRQLVMAVVHDVAFGGVCVRLARAAASETSLMPGAQVALALHSPRYRYKNHMLARIVSLRDSDRAQTVHLAFEGAHADMPMHSNQHFALFNRRTLQRGIVPAAGINLEAEVTPAEASDRSLRVYPVAVRNLSNVGISLRINAGANQYLSQHDELSLTLRLPGRDGVRRIACHVRHRHIDGIEFVYGCEYDWNATLDPLAVAEELLEFMLENADLR